MQLEVDRLTAVQLSARGWGPAEIAAHINELPAIENLAAGSPPRPPSSHVSRQAVGQDLKEVFERLAEEQIGSLRASLGSQLQKERTLRREAWEEYERSKENYQGGSDVTKELVGTVPDPDPALIRRLAAAGADEQVLAAARETADPEVVLSHERRVTRKVEGRVGDPRFLAIIAGCHQREMELQRLNQPSIWARAMVPKTAAARGRLRNGKPKAAVKALLIGSTAAERAIVAAQVQALDEVEDLSRVHAALAEGDAARIRWAELRLKAGERRMRLLGIKPPSPDDPLAGGDGDDQVIEVTVIEKSIAP